MGSNINNKEIQQNNEIKFAENVNYTDPVVLHDPKIPVATIIDTFSDDKNSHNTIDTLKVNAIRFPEIRINNLLVPLHRLLSMSIDYTDFAPSAIVKLHDPDDYIRFNGLVQMNNEMVIIFTTPIDGVYKKVSLRFYIKNQHFNDNDKIVTYYGSYKLEKLHNMYSNDLIFNGCSQCKAEKSNQLSTWELLHTISNLTGFGFAATDKCKDIDDRLPRIMFSQNYLDFLTQVKDYAGVDDNSIFDYWIDLYGYIVLVNLSYLFNENVQVDQLSIYNITPINFQYKDALENKPAKIFRVITNYQPMNINNNVSFTDYSFEISNLDSYYRSFTHTTCFDITNGNNIIKQQDIEIIQNSLDGQHTQDYVKQYNKPIYMNFNNYDINLQKEIRKSFFAKHTQRILKVRLNHMNLGFQRGTLLYVMIYEANPEHKKVILSSSSNAINPKDPKGEEDFIPDYNKDIDNKLKQIGLSIVNDGTTMLLNVSVSGLYYITGMKFYYDYISQEIIQELYLIKQGKLDGFSNKYTLPKIDEPNK